MPIRVLSPAILVAALSGCSSASNFAGEAAGFGVGAAVGAATGNPFIGVGVGLAVSAAVDEGWAYYQRRERDAIHNAIAAVAGEAEVGVVRGWSVRSTAPLVNARGQVQVTRTFGGEISCREIVYSEDGSVGRFFVAVICKGGEGWRWAVSAPSTQRWGGLQ